MSDIFEAAILCENCNKRAEKGFIVKDGFRIRSWVCNSCGRRWYHPADLNEYEQFQKLKQKEFHVKLRMVGNSWAVSIPMEIIEFEEEFMNMKNKFEREFERMVKLCFEEPGKLSLFFNRKDEIIKKEREKKIVEETQKREEYEKQSKKRRIEVK